MGRDYGNLAKQLGIKGRVSGRQLVGNCPLHQDRRPSFSLNIDSGLYTCFSRCGSGTFTQLVSKILGCTITQSHDWILQTSSMMPVPNPEPEVEEKQDLRWLEYFNSLNRNVMPQWWFARGFTWETANEWDIRYCDERSQLVIPFCIPYWMSGGIPRALLGTITRNFKREPKYQNSPKLPRSEYLFGLAQAQGNVILISEGACDCMWLAQNGYPSAALLGLNMSQDHIRLLHGFQEICLALDSDEAGQIARDVIRYEFMESGRPFSQITELKLPKGRKDVGESTPEELREAFESRRPM